MIAGEQGDASDFGTVHVASNVDAAGVEVDGEPVGITPLKLIMRAGNHEVSVKKQGYAPYAKSMDIKAQREVVLKVSLSEEAVTPP
jgi:hypothetical protein